MFAKLPRNKVKFCYQHLTLSAGPAKLHRRTQSMSFLYGHCWFHSQQRRAGPPLSYLGKIFIYAVSTKFIFIHCKAWTAITCTEIVKSATFFPILTLAILEKSYKNREINSSLSNIMWIKWRKTHLSRKFFLYMYGIIRKLKKTNCHYWIKYSVGKRPHDLRPLVFKI